MIYNQIDDDINAEDEKLNSYIDYVDAYIDDVDHLIIDNKQELISDDEESFCSINSDTINPCNYKNVFEQHVHPLTAMPRIPSFPSMHSYARSDLPFVSSDDETHVCANSNSLIYTVVNEAAENENENNTIECNTSKKTDDNNSSNSSNRDYTIKRCNKSKGKKTRKKSSSSISEKNQFVLDHLYKYVPQNKYPRASLLRAFNCRRIDNIYALRSAYAIDKEYSKWRVAEAKQRRYLRCLKRKRRNKENSDSDSEYELDYY